MASGVHSAAASAAGYLYQVRWALVNLLREGRTRPDQVISLEMHDDVAWEDVAGSATELLQTKWHAKETAGLADKDTDIWKTLLIWLKRDDAVDPNGPDFALVTTSSAQPGTAAYTLRPDPVTRDVPAAVELLTKAAEDSSSTSTEKGRDLFRDLTKAEKTTFLSRVRVLDQSLALEDLDEAVRQELQWALPPDEKAQDRFVAELWRWWDGMTVGMLRGQRTGVAVSNLRTFVQELRDEYGPDSLRTTVLKGDVTDEEIERHSTGRFVDQMVAVRYAPRNLRLAVIDYYRAVTQETEWLSDDLIGLHELQAFEDNLRDEWERAFNDMVDDLSDASGVYDPEAVDVAVKLKAGKDLLRALLDSTEVTLRKHYTDGFFARGKRHELAHRQPDVGIGWHPDFADGLEKLLADVVGEGVAESVAG